MILRVWSTDEDPRLLKYVPPWVVGLVRPDKGVLRGKGGQGVDDDLPGVLLRSEGSHPKK